MPWIHHFSYLVVHNLAQLGGITTAQTHVQKFTSCHHTFLSRRFDRTSDGKRIHFASAMTLLQRFDGDDAGKGASYLELAEFIMRQGARSSHDLEQL